MKALLADLGYAGRLANDRCCYVLLVLCGIERSTPWADARALGLGIDEIRRQINAVYRREVNKGQGYAPNTRETIRDETVKPFIADGVLEPVDPSLPTNSSKWRYRPTDEFLAIVKSYGSPRYEREILRFRAVREERRKAFETARSLEKVPVVLPGGDVIKLAQGEHGRLIQAILEDFLPRFAPGSVVLIVSDTDGQLKADSLADAEMQKKLDALSAIPGQFGSSIDPNPDVLAWYPRENWLFACEACHSVGPIDEGRKRDLSLYLKELDMPIVYVTCFSNRSSMRKWLPDLAWETEAWCADTPDHMIHLNGTRFMGPYES